MGQPHYPPASPPPASTRLMRVSNRGLWQRGAASIGGHFDRSLLPPAKTFYEAEGVIDSRRRPDGRGWIRGDCWFHKSKSHTSFAVHLDGGFFCHGCGVKGGDLIDFVKLRDGVGFQAACKILGAWVDRDGEIQKKPMRPTVAVRYLVWDVLIDGIQYTARVLDEPKDPLQLDRRIYAEACDRLTEIRAGDPERFENEAEVQWELLSLAWGLIQMEVGR